MAKVRNRFDETWHRLRDWNGGQTKSEMLAWQVIAAEGYTRIDPALPRGGPDGGRDAMCERDGETWVLAVYFPGEQLSPGKIKKKLLDDIKGAKKRGAVGIAFVTNQEIGLANREAWEQIDPDVQVDLFHLLRVTQILQDPSFLQTREEFLDIVGGPPPLLVKASVVGVAHAFVDDGDLFDRFVEMREERIRERSDEGHARVRAEREERERAERERRDRAEAERRRAAAERPWDIAAQVDFGSLFANSSIMDSLTKAYEPPNFASLYPGFTGEKPKPPEPLSDEQIREKVDVYREVLRKRWVDCRDYLAGVAFSGLRFRIENGAESFLTDLEVILTFHGARGVDFVDLSDFRWQRVENPAWTPPSDPRLGYSSWETPSLPRPKDYPIRSKHNDDGDLEVRINLPSLRPQPAWTSDDYSDDVVLVVDPESDVDEVQVSWAATANPYGKAFIGEPFTVPVERVDMRELLLAVMESTREAS